MVIGVGSFFAEKRTDTNNPQVVIAEGVVEDLGLVEPGRMGRCEPGTPPPATGPQVLLRDAAQNQTLAEERLDELASARAAWPGQLPPKPKESTSCPC